MPCGIFSEFPRFLPKDTLFHIIAHDIKSPMSIMISFTEFLQDDFDDFSKVEIFKIIDRLNKSSREGLQLLENLPDWAKSQTGKLTFTPEPGLVSIHASEEKGVVTISVTDTCAGILSPRRAEPLVWRANQSLKNYCFTHA
jgi:signal transduction histidine kinase